MFNHHHAVAAIDQAMQHANEFVHIGHVQTDGGFVQHIQGVRRFVATACDIVTHFAEFGHQLDALCFTPTECGRWLAQSEITQAHIFEQLQGVRDVGHGGEKFNRFIDFHLQHIANAFATPTHRQCFGVEARAVTAFTQHFHIGQKAHLDGAQTLAFAGVAATFTGVEAETPCTITTRFGFERFSKQFANGVPKTNVGGRATAGCFADGCLVHFEHTVNGLITVNTVATHPCRVLAVIVRFAPCLG